MISRKLLIAYGPKFSYFQTEAVELSDLEYLFSLCDLYFYARMAIIEAVPGLLFYTSLSFF